MLYRLWGNSRVVHGPPCPPPRYATADLGVAGCSPDLSLSLATVVCYID